MISQKIIEAVARCTDLTLLESLKIKAEKCKDFELARVYNRRISELLLGI